MVMLIQLIPHGFIFIVPEQNFMCSNNLKTIDYNYNNSKNANKIIIITFCY